MGFFEDLSDFVREHPGRAFGALIGFVAGIAILLFGFWKMILLFILAFAGYVIGKMLEGDGIGGNPFSRFFGKNRDDDDLGD